MRLFLKTFAIAEFVQLVFVAQMFVTGIGDGLVYRLYGIPLLILDSVLPSGHLTGTDSSIWPLLFLLLPSVMYSLLIACLWGGVITLVRRFNK